MTTGVEHYPRHYEFAIGDNPSVALPGYTGVNKTITPAVSPDNDTVAVFKPLGVLGNLFLISLENMGLATFNFSIQQSNDNGVLDPYVAVNMRYNAANVSSLNVVAGGRALVILESLTKPWVRLVVPNASADATAAVVKPFGRVVVTHYNGDLDRVERTGLS